MQATITVNMDNAAFDPDWAPELARILRVAADRVESHRSCADLAGLLDVNGNKVGRIRFSGMARRRRG